MEKHPNYRRKVNIRTRQGIADAANRAEIEFCGTNGMLYEEADISKESVRTFVLGICDAQTISAVTRVVPCTYEGACKGCTVIRSIRGHKLSPGSFVPR